MSDSEVDYQQILEYAVSKYKTLEQIQEFIKMLNTISGRLNTPKEIKVTKDKKGFKFEFP